MAGMGPAPKDASTRRRRNPSVQMRQLDGNGRTGEIPAWPLSSDMSLTVKRTMAEDAIDELEAQLTDCDNRSRKRLERELQRAQRIFAETTAQLEQQQVAETELWQQIWLTPQATVWEELGWTREVAQYVRWKTRGEMGDLDAAKEARQWSDRLGLNPLALLRLRWEITERSLAVVPAPPTTKKRAPAKQSAAARKRAIAKDPRQALSVVK